MWYLIVWNPGWFCHFPGCSLSVVLAYNLETRLGLDQAAYGTSIVFFLSRHPATTSLSLESVLSPQALLAKGGLDRSQTENPPPFDKSRLFISLKTPAGQSFWNKIPKQNYSQCQTSRGNFVACMAAFIFIFYVRHVDQNRAPMHSLGVQD